MSKLQEFYKKGTNNMDRLTDRETRLAKPGSYPTMLDIVTKLVDYENAEEDGLLLKLPFKVGDTVYRPVPKLYRQYNKMVITEINIDEDGIYFRTGGLAQWKIETIGKSIFLTEEEAKQVIKKYGKRGKV